MTANSILRTQPSRQPVPDMWLLSLAPYGSDRDTSADSTEEEKEEKDWRRGLFNAGWYACGI